MSPYSERLAVELRRLDIGAAPLERLLADLPQGLMLVEAPSGRVLFVSRQVTRILGEEVARLSSLADADRLDWQGLSGPGGRRYTAGDWPLARAVRHGEVVAAEEILMVHADGRRCWIRVSAAPMTSSDGRVVAGIALFNDVTGQKTAEERATALARLARQLGAARTAADVYGVVIDRGRRTLGAYAGGIVRPAGDGEWLEFIEAVGYPEQLLEEYRRFPADAPVPAAHVLQSGQPLFLTEDEWIARFRGPATASPTRAIAVLPLRVEERTTAALTLSFDVPRSFPPAERQFMETLADSCGQALERALLYDAEREARATAEAANRAKDEFIAMISHDLRTPLNSLSGWAALLQRQVGDDAALARPLSAIQQSADVQGRLVSDLLDLSRAVSGKLHISPDALVPETVAQAAVEAIRFAAEEKGIALTMDVGCSPVARVFADPVRLQQMLGNLLSNAIRFTPGGGAVAVTVTCGARNVAFTVSDTGEGIDPHLLPFVFDRFRQVGRSRDDGLGLGLAIVRQLAQAHGGVVYACERGDKSGAAFTLLLPIAAESTHARSIPAAPARLSGIEILALLDPERVATGRLQHALEAHGASVCVVHNATAVSEAVQRRRPEVVLCSVTAPGSEGATSIRQLRETSWHGPIAALVPRTSPGELMDADLIGCNTFIPDPVDTEQLVLAIRALARSPDDLHLSGAGSSGHAMRGSSDSANAGV